MKTKFYSLFFLILGALALKAQTIPNSGFEDWTLVGGQFMTPDHWNCNCGDFANTINRTEPGHNGSYSIQAFMNGYAETGIITNIHPTQLTAFTRVTITNFDAVHIWVNVYNQGILVDTGIWDYRSPIVDWQQVNIPISQHSAICDSVAIIVGGGNSVGTVLWADDLSFGTATDIEENTSQLSSVKLLNNPVMDKARLQLTLQQEEKLSIDLYDVSGRHVRTFADQQSFTSGTYRKDMDFTGVAPGVYFLNITTGEERRAIKLVKR